MSGIEHADGIRSDRVFPVEWGRAPGDRDSEERALWVKRQVARHSATTAHRTLAARDTKLLAYLRQAELAARRQAPA